MSKITIDRSVVEQALKLWDAQSVDENYDYGGAFLLWNEHARPEELASKFRAALEQPQVEQEPDWRDLYQKQKRRAEMWIAKYEKDIGKLEVAVPVAVQPQVVGHQHKSSTDNSLRSDQGHLITISGELAAGAIAALASYCNTGEIDGADDLLAEFLFERDHQPVEQQPQVEREPPPNGATHKQPKQGAFYKRVDGKWYVWSRMENGKPHRWYISPGTTESCLEPLYIHPQPPRQPLTEDEINTIWRNSTHMTIVEVVRAIEAAHGIKEQK